MNSELLVDTRIAFQFGHIACSLLASISALLTSDNPANTLSLASSVGFTGRSESNEDLKNKAIHRVIRNPNYTGLNTLWLRVRFPVLFYKAILFLYL